MRLYNPRFVLQLDHLSLNGNSMLQPAIIVSEASHTLIMRIEISLYIYVAYVSGCGSIKDWTCAQGAGDHNDPGLSSAEDEVSYSYLGGKA